jgi:hypothetical protein
LLAGSWLSGETNEKTDDPFAKGITVDLREPVWSEGVLTTEKGGLIQGPNLRIQARKILYKRKIVDGKPVFAIEAEDELILEFGEYVFIGKRLEYDFQTKSGIIYEGRSTIEPWYFGGERIELLPDGSYTVSNGFVTTSENYNTNWQIAVEKAVLTENRLLNATNVEFRFIKLPLFWLPSFKMNLDSIFDAPVRYLFRWGGHQGPRIGAIYEVFSWNRFKTFLHMDYRVKRGFGGGIETAYRSADHRAEFRTINYVAKDSSISNPHERTRYRFQGLYHNTIVEDKVSLDISYDKLSDKDMATDYNDRGLELDTAGRTELQMRHQSDNWITNLYSRIRLNNFQTINQELPTLETRWKPFLLGHTGLISDSYYRGSYLDFKYANNLKDVEDYHSSRLELSHRSYRPFVSKLVTITPEAGIVGILYGTTRANSGLIECGNKPPKHGPRSIGIALLGCEANTTFYRLYRDMKHVMMPYIKYNYYTSPSLSPKEHYIFDIDDGWYRLNVLRFGLQQSLLVKSSNGLIGRRIMVDIYANAFFNTPTIERTIPYVYTKLEFRSLTTINHTITGAWDFQRANLSFLNIRTEWTYDADLALAAEFRHRNSYAWRKVEYSNYILDSYRSENQLRHSSLSDRRSTFLVHMFYRFYPNWAIELESREGWDRLCERNYREFEVDLLTTLSSAWRMKFSYQHKEDDHRVAIYLSVGLKRPDQDKCDALIPCVQY